MGLFHAVTTHRSTRFRGPDATTPPLLDAQLSSAQRGHPGHSPVTAWAPPPPPHRRPGVVTPFAWRITIVGTKRAFQSYPSDSVDTFLLHPSPSARRNTTLPDRSTVPEFPPDGSGIINLQPSVLRHSSIPRVTSQMLSSSQSTSKYQYGVWKS